MESTTYCEQEHAVGYDAALLRSGIPETHRPHFRRWLGQYHRFCDEQTLPAAGKRSVERFTEYLRRKGREQWQCRQARRAVELAITLSEKGAQVPAADHPPLSGLNGKEHPAPAAHAMSTTSLQARLSECRSHAEAWDRVLDSVTRAIKLKHYARSTLINYTGDIRRFRRFLRDKNPGELTEGDARAYLEHLAIDRDVAGSTQNGAFNALLFLYTAVLRIPFENMESTARAKRPRLIPTVLWQDECSRVIALMSGIHRCVIEVAYGCGLRVSEAVGIRMQDIDINRGILTVKLGKGGKDRVQLLPRTTLRKLRYYMDKARKQWREDRGDPSFEGVFLPENMEGKRGAAGKAMEFGWYWLFPAPRLTAISPNGTLRRYHIQPTALQRQVRRAVREAGITKKVTPHTFRHSAATHLLQAGYDIRQVQEFLGHTDIRTTMIYLHILKNEQKPLRSPLDILRENESQTRKGGARQDKNPEGSQLPKLACLRE